MKIEHLYYFLVAANTKSINKAAQKLFISQQHLSRIIAILETELNTKLFQRTNIGIELTPKGMYFYRHAEKIVEEYREVQTFFYLDTLPALNEQKNLTGQCNLVLPFFFSLFLSDFMQRFHEVFPNIDLRTFEGNAHPSEEEIQQSDDLFLVIDTPDNIEKLLLSDSELASYYIGDTTVSLCVNRSSALASKTLISHSDIANSSQTGYPHSTWNGKFNKNKLLFISSNIYRHLDSVVQNNSVCVVPSYTRTSIYAEYPDIILLPIEKSRLNPIYIFHQNGHKLTDAETAVVRFLAEYMKKLEQVEKADFVRNKSPKNFNIERIDFHE